MPPLFYLYDQRLQVSSKLVSPFSATKDHATEPGQNSSIRRTSAASSRTAKLVNTENDRITSQGLKAPQSPSYKLTIDVAHTEIDFSSATTLSPSASALASCNLFSNSFSEHKPSRATQRPVRAQQQSFINGDNDKDECFKDKKSLQGKRQTVEDINDIESMHKELKEVKKNKHQNITKRNDKSDPNMDASGIIDNSVLTTNNEPEYELSRLVGHSMDEEDMAVEIVVLWKDGDESLEPEACIQRDQPELLYDYWRDQGGRDRCLFGDNNTAEHVYHVFSILDHRSARRSRKKGKKAKSSSSATYVSRNSGYELQIQWVGYPIDESTWEPEDKVRDITPYLYNQYWNLKGGRDRFDIDEHHQTLCSKAVPGRKRKR